MLKNITLSAEENLIKKAREIANRQHSTLNARFRLWLRQYVNSNTGMTDFDKFMEELGYARPTGKYSREEMNER